MTPFFCEEQLEDHIIYWEFEYGFRKWDWELEENDENLEQDDGERIVSGYGGGEAAWVAQNRTSGKLGGDVRVLGREWLNWIGL